jgi:hypothetical protein
MAAKMIEFVKAFEEIQSFRKGFIQESKKRKYFISCECTVSSCAVFFMAKFDWKDEGNTTENNECKFFNHSVINL